MLPQKPFVPASAATKSARSSCCVGVRHRDVAGQEVEQRRDVGGALDAGVPAQRHDAAAGAADVAQQRLQDRRRCGCTARRRCGGSSRPRRRTPWSAPGRSCAVSASADLARTAPAGCRRPRCDQLRGVAGEVPLEHLEHAPRVLQGLVRGRGRRRAPARRCRATRRARSPSGRSRLGAGALGRTACRAARRRPRPRRPRTASVAGS